MAQQSRSSSLHVVMAVANNPYPQDVRVRNEAQALVRAGYAVGVIAPLGRGQPRREVVDGVHVHRFTDAPTVPGPLGYVVEFGFVTVAVALYVLAAMVRGRVDVLHLHNPPDTLFAAALLPRALGVRVVYDLHDLSPELYRARYREPSRAVERALRWLERCSSRLAHRVVTVNDTYRRTSVERNGLDPEHVVVVRNGPPMQRLQDAEPDPEVRALAPTLIGYLGQIGPQDGADHMLRALHHLQHDLGERDWAAVVIGPAEDPVGLEALTRELGLEERVHFMGYQPDDVWRRLLAAVDIGVVPDPANGLNEHSTMIKTMEYMALGKPVVAYDLAEHRVSAGEAALYATPNDPHALAEAIATLLRDACLRERLGREGQRRVREHLAWEYSAQRLLDLYATARSW